jgi:RND family efflux transporter MFP subunit
VLTVEQGGRRVRRLLPFILAAPALLAGCDERVSSSQPVPSYSVYEIGSPVVNRVDKFHGRVVPADLTRASFRIPGKIDLLAVQAGQQVVEGEVIARIENSIQRQRLADAQAQYELSRRQLERASDLLDIGAITPARRDELNAGFRLASANLRLAEAELSYTVITAPFDGTVADVNKELFESVLPGETVVTVYRNDRIDVLVNVPDNLPARSKQTEAMTAYRPTVTFSGRQGSYRMQYLKRSMARNPEVEAFQIWLTMPVTGAPIPPGVPATVTVELDKAGFSTDSGLLVPLTALQADLERNRFRVWRYRQGIVSPVSVSIARITRGGALIAGSLQAGDVVVTSGLDRLQPGQAITISAGAGSPVTP